MSYEGMTRTAVQTLKGCVAYGAVVTGATALSRRRSRNRLRILMYHGVVPQVRGPCALGNLFISEAAFARQMGHLKRAFQALSLDEAIAVSEARRDFPDRALVITFDDGYRNVISTALPILQRFQLPATVFVMADMVGREEWLWCDALRVLIYVCAAQRRLIDLGFGVMINGQGLRDQEGHFIDAGRRIRSLTPQRYDILVARLMELCREERLVEQYQEFALGGWGEWQRAVGTGLVTVGSHGLRHRDLTTMSRQEQDYDLSESRLRIEKALGQPCLALAYPYGRWNVQTAQAASLAGYRCAVTTDGGSNTSACDPMALHRTMVGDKGDFYLFCARASGAWDRLRGVTAWEPSARAVGVS